MRKWQIVLFLLFVCSGLQAQNCMPNSGSSSFGTSSSNLSNIKIGSLPVGQDGLIHVTYSFDGTVDANTQNLMNAAAQQWNGDLGTTGVVFDRVSSGGIVTIGRNDNATNCIAIQAQIGPLNYNGQWLQLAASNPNTAIGSIAHEFGHFLGLDDAGTNPGSPTIMNNPTGSCAQAQANTNNVQFRDATVASGCIATAYSLQNMAGGGDPGGCTNPDGSPCQLCNPDGRSQGGCSSPIIIDIEGEGFHLTSATNGVEFDISGTQHPIQIAWTDPRFHNAFLALPGSDGLIHNGKQLFGNFSPQPSSTHPNGFLALAQFDKPENGGNGDGIIDDKDAVFSQLRLWIDENHDGICQPSELHRLPEFGVYSLSLGYRESRRIDEFGNAFRYRGRVNPGDRRDPRDETQTGEPGRWEYDVFLVTK